MTFGSLAWRTSVSNFSVKFTTPDVGRAFEKDPVEGEKQHPLARFLSAIFSFMDLPRGGGSAFPTILLEVSWRGRGMEHSTGAGSAKRAGNGFVALIGCGVLSLACAVPLLGAGCDEVKADLDRANQALNRRDVAVAQQALSPLDAAGCPQVLLLSARLAEASRNPQQAEDLYTRYTTAAPRDARGFAHFGRFLLDNGRYPQAEAAARRAFTLDPRLAGALLLRGRILGLKGQASQAEAALAEAVRSAPENPEGHYQLGVFHDGRQQNHKAAAAFEKVVRLTPADPRAYDYLALNLEPAGDVKRAEWAYKKGLSLNRGPRFDAFLYYNYGRFLMKQNRLGEAKKHLDKAVTLTPQARSARYERGKLNLKLGNLKAARDDAERALALKDPAGVILDLQVHYLLARIHRRLGDEQEARRYSELSRQSSVPLEARRRRSRGGGR